MAAILNRKGEGGGERRVFFLPSPSPSAILNPSNSPLKSVFDSSQLSGSIYSTSKMVGQRHS